MVARCWIAAIDNPSTTSLAALTTATRRKRRVALGVRNYLIEGVSGAGKTAVCRELQRRGHHAINGDVELAYQGDPETGAPLPAPKGHAYHIWDVEKVRSLAADRTHAMTFFCGGCRNVHRFVELFDKVFVLQVDLETLQQRLSARPAHEFGGKPGERAFIARLHATGEDLPPADVNIEATAPLTQVVDQILARCSGRR